MIFVKYNRFNNSRACIIRLILIEGELIFDDFENCITTSLWIFIGYENTVKQFLSKDT